MPSHRIHFGSARAGVYGDVPGAPLYIDEARRHANAQHPTAEAIRLNSRADLSMTLRRLRDEGSRLEYMDFHSHGAPGRLVLGEGSLWDGHETVDNWHEFDDESYRRMFSPGAEIEFHGCSIASEGRGEYFLVHTAWIFLRASGGVVSGYRSLAYSYDFTEVPLRIPDAWDRVEAHVSDGHVVLHNARALSLPRLRERAHQLTRRLQRHHHANGYGRRADHTNAAEASRHIERAQGFLVGSQQRYSTLLRACNELDAAQRVIPNLGAWRVR